MTTKVQEAFDSAGWNPTIAGVGAGNAVFLVATGTNGGTPSVSSITLGGVAADGQRLVLVGSDVIFFAWWNTLTAGDKTLAATTTDIGLTDCVLIEFSGWTGSATAVEDEASGADPSAGLNHDGGSVTLAGPGIVLAGGRYDVASGVTAWSELILTGGGSREIQGYAIVGGADTVSSAWTSQSAITANTAVVAIAEGGGGGGGDIAATGSQSFGSSAGLNATGALAGTGAVAFGASADLDATGSLAAVGAIAFGSSADLTSGADNELVAVGAIQFGSSADLTATGEIAASGAAQFGSSADLSATGSLVAVGAVQWGSSADLSAVGNLLAASTVGLSGSADLDAIGVLLSSAAMSFASVAELTDANAEAQPEVQAVVSHHSLDIRLGVGRGRIVAHRSLLIT